MKEKEEIGVEELERMLIEEKREKEKKEREKEEKTEFKLLDLKELKAQVEEDLKFDEYTLIIENQKNTAKHHYYITLGANEEYKLEQFKELRDELYKQLYIFYKWGENKEIYPGKRFEKEVDKGEVRILIEGDKKWMSFMKLFKKQERIVKYLEKVESLFTNRYYSISNAVKLLEKEKYG